MAGLEWPRVSPGACDAPPDLVVRAVGAGFPPRVRRERVLSDAVQVRGRGAGHPLGHRPLDVAPRLPEPAHLPAAEPARDAREPDLGARALDAAFPLDRGLDDGAPGRGRRPRPGPGRDVLRADPELRPHARALPAALSAAGRERGAHAAS